MKRKCYYCQSYITDVGDLIEYKRHNFHTNCYQQYLTQELAQKAMKQKIADTVKTQSLYSKQELADKEELEKYLRNLFGTSILSPKIENQIEKYYDKGYTFSGILKTLMYFFDLRGNSLEEANGGIGIVPYVYEEAKEYYRQVWEARQANAYKNIEEYRPKVREVTITIPKRQTKKLFPILESEDFDE